MMGVQVPRLAHAHLKIASELALNKSHFDTKVHSLDTMTQSWCAGTHTHKSWKTKVSPSWGEDM